MLSYLRHFWAFALLGLIYAGQQIPESVRDQVAGPLMILGGLVALGYAVRALRKAGHGLPWGFRVVVGCLPVLPLLMIASGVAFILGSEQLASDLVNTMVGVTVAMSVCGGVGLWQLKRMARTHV